MFRAVASSLFLVVLSCGQGDGQSDGNDPFAEGPGGSYAGDMRCSVYNTTPNGDFCGTGLEQNYFQCDHQPGEACIEAPRPSADPDQVAWCCSFPCVRFEANDHRCLGGTDAYACTLEDTSAYAEEVGCVDGVDPGLICC